MRRVAIGQAALVLVGMLSFAWLAGAAPAPWTKKPGRVLTNSVGMKLAYIPTGKFVMGSPEGEMNRQGGEQQHDVAIGRWFYLGVYEVTQEEYEKVMGKNPSYFCATGGGQGLVRGLATKRFPVESVTWDEAVEFCTKLSALPAEQSARRKYRLPTEAEWEYACRAGTKNVFHYGNTLTGTEANINGTAPYGVAGVTANLRRTCPVGSYKPNAWGMYDMHGNVFEWTADWHGANYYPECKKLGLVKDPPGPATGSQRIHRGGAWPYQGFYARTAFRGHYPPGSRYNCLGLRVACEVGR
jgi:formylglycine-generating enzyme required for sulfatase activity